MDYIFYKVYAYYKKKKDLPIMTGIYFLLLLQVCCLFFIGIVFNLLTHGMLSNQNKNFNKEYFYAIYFLIIALLFTFNIIRYSKKKRVEELERKYNNKKGLQTWQIFILPVFIIALAIGIIVVFK